MIEIKVTSPKMTKRLEYLGFREQNLNITGLLPHQITKRYFVHQCGLQVRVNNKEKTLSFINDKGFEIETQPVFLSSYLKAMLI